MQQSGLGPTSFVLVGPTQFIAPSATIPVSVSLRYLFSNVLQGLIISIQGDLCAMVPLDPASFQIGSMSYKVIRINILILTFVILFLLLTFHFYKSSVGQKKKHSIPKTRHSLLTLRQHTLYTFLILFSLLLDRVGLTITRVFYLDLGRRNGFIAFWFNEIIFFILIHVLSPTLIYLNASQKL